MLQRCYKAKENRPFGEKERFMGKYIVWRLKFMNQIAYAYLTL